MHLLRSSAPVLSTYRHLRLLYCAGYNTGFVIAGIGGEQSLQDMDEAIAASVSALPQHLPRSVQGASTPLEVLAATSNGIDLIHSSWPYELTLAGKAFTADLTMSSSSSSSSSTATPMNSTNSAAAAAAVGGMVLDLHDPIYRADKLPLLEGCTCITCKQHMRAYIHHLLCAKEMVGSVLLQIHNMHHFLQFFVQIRASIEGGWSEQYHEWWLAGRPTGVAQEL
jgi:queuine tRNA-ribosyltransferase accessory subunit